MCQVHGESDGRADGVVRKGSDPFFFFLIKKTLFILEHFKFTRKQRE